MSLSFSSILFISFCKHTCHKKMLGGGEVGQGEVEEEVKGLTRREKKHELCCKICMSQ